MDERKLLQTLIAQSLLSEELAQQITVESAQSGESIEDLIYKRRLLDEISVAKAKSEVLGIPYQKVNVEAITDDLIKLIPEETANAYRVIPMQRKDSLLVVGMIKPWDTKAQDALRFVAKQNKLNLGIYLITPEDLDLALRKYSPYQSEVEKAIKSLNVKSGTGPQELRPISLEESVQSVAEEAPIIRIVSSTLKAAVEQGASDIHIEPERNRVRVRFRVDGILHEVSSFPIGLEQAIVSRVKILSNLKIDETRIPQDGRFRTVIYNKDIDFRVSTFPTPAGEKVVIRVLDPTIGLKSIGDLGLTGKTADMTKKAIAEPFGMVLITGPTGSGKTTTLYALLQLVKRDELNVVSLEDPIEYYIEGVSQSQVRPEIGYTFASGLRQILRQDPDVIMVGEIRDSETAGLAVHAALTGHVVLSTLHTNDAVGVIPRLIDMGVEPFLLPSSLNVMISQRLVRRLCQKCKKASPAAPEVEKIINEELGKISDTSDLKNKYKAPYNVYHAEGCKECQGKGFTGRIALFEGFEMTRGLEEAINSSPTESKIKDEAAKQNMVTLRQDGIIKALDGTVTIEDVFRTTEND